MATTTTTNIALVKPDYSEAADVQVLNGNADKIDAAFGVTYNAFGIVVNGNKAALSAATDQFVILKNSSISGCANGLYLAAKAIPANTAIDSTYLTAVTIGGLNTATNKLRMKKTLSVTSDENSTIDLGLTDEYTVTSVRGYQSQNIVCMPYMMSNGAWRARIVHANTGQPLASGARIFIVTYMRA